jgi:hypothetical protein
MVHEGKTIAAQAASMWEHNGEDCRSGNGGIDRVAACAQDVERRCRRQRMACDHRRLATMSNLNWHRRPNLVPRAGGAHSRLGLHRRYEGTSRKRAGGKSSIVLAPR